MVPFIIDYSLDRVNKAGIKAIRYPGLWATSFIEIKKMRQYMENK
jgi:hypothetical protein